MSLPKVSVHGLAGEAPTVTVNGSLVRGVRSAQITVTADGLPQVSLIIPAGEVTISLPAQVTVLRAGASAIDFVDQLSPQRLELAALEHMDDDVTQGEAFLAAVQSEARQFDDRS